MRSPDPNANGFDRLKRASEKQALGSSLIFREDRSSRQLTEYRFATAALNSLGWHHALAGRGVPSTREQEVCMIARIASVQVATKRIDGVI